MAAQHLLRQALPLARWSVVGKHLLQRIYGTMILAASDTAEALVVLERAEVTLETSDACPLCDIMLAVPAAILCADTGDLAAAGRHLAVAATSATRWDGTAWRPPSWRPGPTSPGPKETARLPPPARRGLPGCSPGRGSRWTLPAANVASARPNPAIPG